MALGAYDMQAAGLENRVVALLPFSADLLFVGALPGLCQLRLEIAAEHDIGTAARHVGCDRDLARLARPGAVRTRWSVTFDPRGTGASGRYKVHSRVRGQAEVSSRQFRVPVYELADVGASLPGATIVSGANLDDLGEYRPGLIAADEKTFDYFNGRPKAPKGADWDAAVNYWRTLHSDAGAEFDAVVELDAGAIVPQVTWGTSPEMVLPVDASVPDPAAAAAAAVDLARAREPQLRPLEACRQLTETALEAHRRNRSGDNMCAAVLWLEDL